MSDPQTDHQDPQDQQDPRDQAGAPTDPKATEIAALQTKLVEMTEAAKRAMADLQNFKRRTEEERADLQIYANLRLLESIFPAIDNLARAFEHIPEDLKENEWIKGIQAVEAGLLSSLEQLGLQAINQTGVPANPNLHEVLMEGDGPAGQVIQIFEKGYSFNGKAIRPAKVQVGKGE